MSAGCGQRGMGRLIRTTREHGAWSRHRITKPQNPKKPQIPNTNIVVSSCRVQGSKREIVWVKSPLNGKRSHRNEFRALNP